MCADYRTRDGQTDHTRGLIPLYTYGNRQTSSTTRAHMHARMHARTHARQRVIDPRDAPNARPTSRTRRTFFSSLSLSRVDAMRTARDIMTPSSRFDSMTRIVPRIESNARARLTD